MFSYATLKTQEFDVTGEHAAFAARILRKYTGGA